MGNFLYNRLLAAYKDGCSYSHMDYDISLQDGIGDEFIDSYDREFIRQMFCSENVDAIREIHSFKMTHYHISSKKLNGLKKERKVIFLSDLHNYCYGNNNDKLLDAIEKEQPDYILVAGDMLVSRIDESTKVAEDFMIQLPKICDTYYANGNHEQRMKEQEDRYGDSFKHYQSILEQAGVHWLSNEKVSVKWDE